MYTQQEVLDLQTQCGELIQSLDLPGLESEKSQTQLALENPDIWNNPQEAVKFGQENTFLEKKIAQIHSLQQKLDDLTVALEMQDEQEMNSLYKQIQSEFLDLQNQSFLTGKFDSYNALLSIHAGAGGIDAQDFAAMLASMYQSFCRNQGWNCEMLSISVGEEGGVKSTTLQITGENVYGLLKEEAGVHRLVRISPFNSGKTRETSFALVEVLPSGLENLVNLQDIQEQDLKWEYSTSSGKGGQSVNTTYSAVKLTHIPTGITVSCQNERSQQQNKQQALKYLKNKLAVVELKKQQELRNELKGDFQLAEWGSQIRSYVLHPYKLVKDHRSGWESADPLEILEQGNILEIIWSVKRATKDQL
jgi:peptide chain release factor 2